MHLQGAQLKFKNKKWIHPEPGVGITKSHINLHVGAPGKEGRFSRNHLKVNILSILFSIYICSLFEKEA